MAIPPQNLRRGVESYILFRHSGAGASHGAVALTPSYVTFDGGGGIGTPIVFKDDVADEAGTPFPPEGGFTSHGIQVINDSSNTIFFSLDGVRDHFALLAGDNILFDFIRAREIWLRGTLGGEDYRLVVW